MQPRIIRTQVPSAHQNQIIGFAGQSGGQARQVVEQVLRCQSDPLIGGAEDLGHLRDHRSEVDSIWLFLEFGQGESIWHLAIEISERTGAQRQVENAFRSAVAVVTADLCSVQTLRETQIVEEPVVDRCHIDILGRSARA